MAFYYLSLVAYILYFVILSVVSPSQNVEFHVPWICMKIELSEVLLRVIVFCPLLFPLRGGWMLTALKANWISWFCRLNVLSTIYPHRGNQPLFISPQHNFLKSLFNQRDTAEKTIKYLCINTLIQQND